RRAMKRSLRLSCPFQNSCVINKSNRRHCQACRLKKCLDIGMKKELIMSDEAVELRRSLIKKKQRVPHVRTAPPTSRMTEEQEAMVRQLAEAQKKTFDSNFIYFRNYRPARRRQDPVAPHQQPPVFLMMPHINDLTTHMIKGIIDFAKIIPFFRALCMEDQIALLKGCALELCFIRFNIVFDNKTRTFSCGQFNYDSNDLAM
ncbi:hypothetical protein GDO81_028479, partial [Engystomops pustulosus]